MQIYFQIEKCLQDYQRYDSILFHHSNLRYKTLDIECSQVYKLSLIHISPQEYLSRAYHDAPRYCADIVSTQIKNDEVILKGEIPARCIQEYRNDLTYFTNGQGVCLTELKGYQPAIGKFICQPRRPNSRIDKVRHMFHKLA